MKIKVNIFLTLLLFAATQLSFCQENKALVAELKKQYDRAYYSTSDSIASNGKQNLYVVIKGDKYGLCDAKGNVLIPPEKYTLVSCEYNNNHIINGYRVRLGDKAGYCDAQGKEIISPEKYTEVFYMPHYNPPLFWVYINDKMGLCDSTGKELFPVKNYTRVTPMIVKGKVHGFWVYEGEKMGFCDVDGSEMVSCNLGYKIYQCCWLKEPGDVTRFKVKKDGRFYILDEKGNKVTNESFDTLIYPPYEEPLIAACKNGKWGFLSYYDASVVIPYEYDDASPFKNGTARVVKDGKSMLISSPLATGSTKPKNSSGRVVSSFPAPDSDVDKNIPNGPKADNNTFAFIIANENYPVAKVPYALNDGWMFEQYCRKTLGIKDENIHLFEDATAGNIIACVEQIKQAAKNANGQATIVFYYAGHAFPDEERNTAYLLPVDGDSKNIATGYSLEKFYKELNSVPTRQLVCFIDACFSGATRDDQMLIGGRGVAIKVKDEIPQGNMVVMTSATGAETAHSFEEMHHGLFTYYLLQKLQETKGDISLGDLSDYVTKMVKRKSVLINQKKQTPTVIPSPQMQSTWREIKL